MDRPNIEGLGDVLVWIARANDEREDDEREATVTADLPSSSTMITPNTMTVEGSNWAPPDLDSVQNLLNILTAEDKQPKMETYKRLMSSGSGSWDKIHPKYQRYKTKKALNALCEALTSLSNISVQGIQSNDGTVACGKDLGAYFRQVNETCMDQVMLFRLGSASQKAHRLSDHLYRIEAYDKTQSILDSTLYYCVPPGIPLACESACEEDGQPGLECFIRLAIIPSLDWKSRRVGRETCLSHSENSHLEQISETQWIRTYLH